MLTEARPWPIRFSRDRLGFYDFRFFLAHHTVQCTLYIHSLQCSVHLYNTKPMAIFDSVLRCTRAVILASKVYSILSQLFFIKCFQISFYIHLPVLTIKFFSDYKFLRKVRKNLMTPSL